MKYVVYQSIRLNSEEVVVLKSNEVINSFDAAVSFIYKVAKIVAKGLPINQLSNSTYMVGDRRVFAIHKA